MAWRDWMFAKKFGWTPSQVEQESAYRMDWLLRIDMTVEQYRQDQGGGGPNGRRDQPDSDWGGGV